MFVLVWIDMFSGGKCQWDMIRVSLFSPGLFLLTQVHQLHSHNPITHTPDFPVTPLLKCVPPHGAKMQTKGLSHPSSYLLLFFRPPNRMAKFTCGGVMESEGGWFTDPCGLLRHININCTGTQRYTVQTAGLHTEFMCRKATVCAKWRDLGLLFQPVPEHRSCCGFAADRPGVRASLQRSSSMKPHAIICRLCGPVVHV